MGKVSTIVGLCLCISMLWIGMGFTSASPTTPVEHEINARMAALLRAYPKQLCSGSGNLLVWCDDSTMVWDDGKIKDHALKLEDPDLEDQMSLRYSRDSSGRPLVDNEPGRIRYEPFFRKMYGQSKSVVAPMMAPVTWQVADLKKTLWVTSINGVDSKLTAVIDDIRKLPFKERQIVAKPAGGFVWRRIAGTKRLSAHSFGIAVDVGLDHADYWRWVRPGADGLFPYRNRIPLSVVRAFEKHGFIWGGKWYRFDTMHFEYRPELLD